MNVNWNGTDSAQNDAGETMLKRPSIPTDANGLPLVGKLGKSKANETVIQPMQDATIPESITAVDTPINVDVGSEDIHNKCDAGTVTNNKTNGDNDVEVFFPETKIPDVVTIDDDVPELDDVAIVSITAAPVVLEPPTETPLEKYWKAVKNNPADFTGWTYLLQYVEQEAAVEDGREAFNTFLARYPYCYGYWKKYADMEKKHTFLKEAEAVYERGVMAVPLSIDLWNHYITFYYQMLEQQNDYLKATKMRKLYERAVSAAGLDFRSDKLWESYIKWELDSKQPGRATALYDRLLRLPTYMYNIHWENFQKHISLHQPKDLLSLDEFLKLRTELLRSGKQNDVILPPEDDDDDDVPPGDDRFDAPPGAARAGIFTPDEETAELRERVIDSRRHLQKNNEAEVTKRWGFEEGIRRPYFHVKPLEKVQLRNWREYLDFEQQEACHERVVVLFERCMIACALYEEFWLKYTKYLEPHNKEAVHNVYERACTVHLTKKPLLHIQWAAFEERRGNLDLASKIITDIDAAVPGLTMVTLRKIGLERRRGNFSLVEEFYSQALVQAEDKKDVMSFYAIKYARYLAKVINNHDKAERILRDAISKNPLNHKLYLQLLDIECRRPGETRDGHMIELFNMALTSGLEVEQRLTFSQRKLEFLEDFSSSVVPIMETYQDHQKLVKEVQSRKRKAAAKEDEKDSKKIKTETETSTIETVAASMPATAAAYAQPSTQPASMQQYDAANTAAWQQWMQSQYGYGYQQHAASWAAYNQSGYYQ